MFKLFTTSEKEPGKMNKLVFSDAIIIRQLLKLKYRCVLSFLWLPINLQVASGSKLSVHG